MSKKNVLLVTVVDDPSTYEEGLEAIQQLQDGESIDQPAIVRFSDESQLTDVFNERTYRLIQVIRDEKPDSIRETARLVGRDKKNVHEELTTLEALGVVRFVENGRAKRPVFPYENLIVTPLARSSDDRTPTTP